MAGARTALLLAALAGYAHIASSTLCSNASFTTWFDSVLAEYDRHKPPILLGDNTTVVALGLHVRYVTVMEQDSEARVTGHLYYDWIDDRLAWNVTEWGCDTMLVSGEIVWTPLISIMNSGAWRNPDAEIPPLRLTADGNVTSVLRLDVRVPFALDLISWPGDTQRVDLKFASANSIVSDDMKLIAKDKQLGDIKPTGTWGVTSVTTFLVRELLEIDPSIEIPEISHEMVVVRVMVSRRAPAHSLTTLAVMLAALVELTAATMLPPELRTPLCACAAFTATLWLSSSLVRIPSATSTPVALWLMGVLCVAAAAASVTAALVARVARLKITPPSFLRRVLTSASSLCELTPNQNTSEAESGAWAAAARLLDLLLTNVLRLALFLILCVYVFS